jgi:hypothetical protein
VLRARLLGALVAMARHDLGLGALEAGDYDTPVTMLRESLAPGAPISRPMTRLALAEALARTGQPDVAAEELRATVLESVRSSDFPEALVPRLARVQGLIALARDDPGEARRRLEESIGGWSACSRGRSEPTASPVCWPISVGLWSGSSSPSASSSERRPNSN